MNLRRDGAALLWLSLVLSILLIIAFLLPVTPQDYWWYLRVGRDTLAAGAIPRVDTLSASQAGSPVTNFSWGAAVIFWLVYRLGGLTATVLLRGLLLAGATSLAWLAARRLGAGRISAALALLAAVLATSNNWSVRPQLFAYPLFAAGLYLLVRWQQGGRRAAWWLPLISLLWVNLHGSFILIFLLVGAALVFGQGDKRSLVIAFAAMLLTSLVNPYGYRAWTYVFETLTLPAQQFSVEWRPPVNAGWQMNIFFAWLPGFALLAGLSPRKLDRLDWAWFAGFGLLALGGQRYVIWFVLVLVLLTSKLCIDWEQKLLGNSKPGSAVLNILLPALLLLLPLAFLPGIRTHWWKQTPPETENTPIAAVRWLTDHPELPGPVWSEIGFASYIEFALPSRPPWIDSRFIPFSVEQWQSYRDVSTARWNWQTLLEATGANLLLVSPSQQPSLVEALQQVDGWCQAYRDEVALIYAACNH